MDEPITYRGREFRLVNAGARFLMERAVEKHEDNEETMARRLVSLAVRTEAGLCTSGEALDAAAPYLCAGRC